jgi:hypothetical protein
MQKNAKLLLYAIYYNPDFIDCYTVYFNFVEKRENGKVFYMCLGMAENPSDFCQHSSGQLGKHNGTKIDFTALPIACQQIVTAELS